MSILNPPPPARGARSLILAGRALRAWTARQVIVAAVAGSLVAVVIGVATVLIPNPLFARDIPPVWWNYPVWLLTSALTGMLVATYARTGGAQQGTRTDREADPLAVPPASGSATERRSSRLGMAGGLLAWFAVGCPVCNKIALLALGYSGAITWFTPVQPFLAVGALGFTGAALLARLRGQVACPVTPRVPVAAL